MGKAPLISPLLSPSLSLDGLGTIDLCSLSTHIGIFNFSNHTLPNFKQKWEIHHTHHHNPYTTIECSLPHVHVTHLYTEQQHPGSSALAPPTNRRRPCRKDIGARLGQNRHNLATSKSVLQMPTLGMRLVPGHAFPWNATPAMHNPLLLHNMRRTASKYETSNTGVKFKGKCIPENFLRQTPWLPTAP